MSHQNKNPRCVLKDMRSYRVIGENHSQVHTREGLPNTRNTFLDKGFPGQKDDLQGIQVQYISKSSTFGG